jgi:hypothetical protein
MYKDTWNPKTVEGKKRIEALLAILKTIQHREDLPKAVYNHPDFKGIKYASIYQQLLREANTRPLTALGELWSKLPAKPNLVVRLFPNEQERNIFLEDLRSLPIEQLRKKYPQIKGLERWQIYKIAATYGIKRNVKDDGIWALKLSPKQQEELLADWRSDPRLPGKSNFDLTEKWWVFGCTSEEALRRGVRALGERRSRIAIMSEIKTSAEVEQIISEKIASAFSQNALNDPGTDALYRRLRKECAQLCRDANYNLTRDKFDDLVDKVVWTKGSKGTLTRLNEYIQSGLSAEEFQKDHPLIPLNMVKDKVREQRGFTNLIRSIKFTSGLLRGVGRYASPEELKSGEDFKFPENDFLHPYSVVSGETGSVLIINGANVGLRHTPIIQENPRVNALVAAREDGDDAVIITNAIDIYTKKAAGASRVLAAIWSGMNVNPDLFPESYKQEVLKILKDRPDDAVIYQKPREALYNVMSGWNKISWEPVSKKSKEVRPVFPRNIYVVFGLREHQFAATMAYWHVHFLTKLKQEQIKTQLKAAYSTLAEVEKGKIPMPDGLQERIMSLLDQDERTIISDVMEEYWQLYYKLAIGYLAKKFEEVLPNCKVIGMSTTHIKIGQEIMTIQISSDAYVTDTVLSQYTHTYGPRVIRQEMPRFIAICHPYSLGPRATGREVDCQGNRDHTLVWTAPVCMEEEYLRQQLKRVPGREHPIAKKIWNDISTPGVLRVRLVNGSLVPEDIPIETLSRYARKEVA